MLKKILFPLFYFIKVVSFAQDLPTGKGLKDINRDILIGATIQSGNADAISLLTENSSIQTVFRREFNLGQTTCYPAWETWKGVKQYDFTVFNNVVNWFYNNQLKVVAHLLAGPNTYYPEWFKTTSYTNQELDDMLTDYMRSVIQSNENTNKVDYWNVVNEALNGEGHYYNNSECKWQQLGWEDDKSGLTGSDKVHVQHPVWLRRSFEIANEFTDKKLELRDYGADFWNVNKSKAFYQLVKHLLNTGVELDAVGLQGHFDLDNENDWNKLNEAIKQYKALGLEVYITEVDLGDKAKNYTTSKAEKQKQQYKLMTKAIVEGGANWICYWGVKDNWNQFWRYNEKPLLFDENFNPKPAYYGVQEGLQVGTITAIGNSYAKNDIIVSPHPIDSKVNISAADLNGGLYETYLMNTLGVKIIENELFIKNNKATIDILQALSSDLYIVCLKSKRRLAVHMLGSKRTSGSPIEAATFNKRQPLCNFR